MSPTRLSDLLDTVEPPTTRVAEEAWNRGLRRVRRRRTAAGAGVAALAVVAIAAIVVPTLGSGAPTDPTRLASPSQTASDPAADPVADIVGTRPITAQITQPSLTGNALLDLARRAQPTGLGTGPSPEGHPLGAAGASYVLGDGAGRVAVVAPRARSEDIRVLEVDLARATDPVTPVRPGSLSPDGRLLALPQPGSVVVVDLVAGTVTSYDIGGPENLEVAWDGDRLLVQQGGGSDAAVLDLADGSVESSPLVEPTTFTARGPVSWGAGAITLPDGRAVAPLFGNDGAALASPPLLGDGVVVGITATSDDTTGPVVVDTATGDPLAFLPTGSVIDAATLLHLDGDVVTLALRPTEGAVLVVTWDWRSGELDPRFLASDGASGVAWSGGAPDSGS